MSHVNRVQGEVVCGCVLVITQVLYLVRLLIVQTVTVTHLLLKPTLCAHLLLSLLPQQMLPVAVRGSNQTLRGRSFICCAQPAPWVLRRPPTRLPPQLRSPLSIRPSRVLGQWVSSKCFVICV